MGAGGKGEVVLRDWTDMGDLGADCALESEGGED